MSLEKVASGLGSIIKIIIYGFILLVIVGIVFAYKMVGDSKEAKASKPVEVVKNTGTITNEPKSLPEKQVSSNEATSSQNPLQKENNLEQKEEVKSEPELKQVSVELIKMSPEESKYMEGYSGVDFKVKVTNNTDKVIGGFMGELTIKDGFGDTLKIISMKYDKDLGANKSIVLDRYVKLNPYIASDQRFAATTKYKGSFELKKVIEE